MIGSIPKALRPSPSRPPLNDRELASLIWLAVFAAWGLSRRDVRGALVPGLQKLIHPKLQVIIAAFIGYVALTVFIASGVGLWQSALLKDTIFWFFGPGFAMLLNMNGASENGYFSRSARSAVGLTVFTEVYIKLKALPLFVELVVQAFVAVVAMLSVVAGLNQKTKVVKSLADAVLTIAGAALIGIVAVQLVSDWASLERVETVLSFALPVWLTLSCLPFIYLLSLVASYESAFTRLKPWRKDPVGLRRSKFALITGIRLRHWQINRFTGAWLQRLANAQNVKEARRVVAAHRAALLEEQAAKQEKARQLREYAGVQGTDENGLQLDRREFEETKGALKWLSTCQMGWYRQRGSYRADLLQFLDDFSSQGLPVEHGITMEVRDDGQAWFAWRRTVTGWCFAIGAGGPAPEYSEYDGPEPPKGYPVPGFFWFGRGRPANRNW